jgi:hypothetical protein
VPVGHPGQDPPQSTAISDPFRRRSVQLAATQSLPQASSWLELPSSQASVSGQSWPSGQLAPPPAPVQVALQVPQASA